MPIERTVALTWGGKEREGKGREGKQNKAEGLLKGGGGASCCMRLGCKEEEEELLLFVGFGGRKGRLLWEVLTYLLLQFSYSASLSSCKLVDSLN